MNFIIFAMPRSGSSYLRILIEEISGARILHEPFNPNHPGWDCSDFDWFDYLNKNGIEKTTNKIFSKYNGFKSLFFQLSEEQNNFITKENKVIFLERKNKIDAAVSAFISMKTNIWQKWHSNSIKMPDYSEFILNEKDIKCFLKESDLFNKYKIKNINKKNFYFVEYENLFSTKKLYEICNFLNLEINEDILKKMINEKNKLNNPKKYKNIKNYIKIKKQFIKIF